MAAFEAVAHALRERVDRPATFYVWHDGRAAQLRCSVTSWPPTDLPFGSDYEVTCDLAAVVGAFLDTRPASTVPIELELSMDGTDAVDEPPLLVWPFDL